MNAPLHHEYHHHDDPHLAQQRRKQYWRRATIVLGIFVLMAGYALLAVSPDTPSDWVLIRVAAGFVLLFIGFGLTILPLLTRTLSGDE